MIGRIRLASGLLLFAFAATHLLNHALGLVSLDALESGREWFLLLWRNPVGTLALYGALLTHMALALWAIYQRGSFRLRPVEWVQLTFGLAIPVWLFAHAVHTRLAYELYGQQDSYRLMLATYMVFVPGYVFQQMLLLVLVWGHCMIGLHQWLRLKSAYGRLRGFALSAALVWPAAALAGIWVAGRDVRQLAADPAWIDQLRTAARTLGQDQTVYLIGLERWLLALAIGLLLAALGLRPVTERLRRRNRFVRITYPGGRRVTVPKGTSVLEASQRNRIPHASVCGGRGRCSTCRVRIEEGLGSLPAASAEEARVLARVRATKDVRLACQIRPEQDCSVAPLLAPDTTAPAPVPGQDYHHGQEREIVVLFADLRDFTALTERKLPYDVVFLLNRYFAAMGQAITRSGGYVDKFIGDGVMALFGLEMTPGQACAAAMAAARAMVEELDLLNQGMVHDLPAPLRIGIGLHLGPAIVGDMGFGGARSLTAVGDTVNTASRLEAATKSFGVQLVVSQQVMQAAGVPADHLETREIEVRGRQGRLVVYLVPEVPALFAPATTGGDV